MRRLCYFFGILLILSACTSSPFKREVAHWLSEHDSAFAKVSKIVVLEKWTQEETKVYFETRLIEEKARLLKQYRLSSCEPCVIRRPGPAKMSYTMADLKTSSIDSVLFPNHGVLRDPRGVYSCDISLLEKKALLDSANRGLIRENEVTIDFLTRMLALSPLYYRLNVTYARGDNTIRTQNLVVRISTADTVINETDLKLFEFLTPYQPPHPQIEKGREPLEAVVRTSMGRAGGGMGVLMKKVSNRPTRDSDWLPWDSITVGHFGAPGGNKEWIHDGMCTIVDTSQIVAIHDGEGYRPAYPIFIYNLTDQVSSFYLGYTQQALDSLGKWRPIEGDNGVPIEGTPGFIIKPGQVGVIRAERYQGNFKTRLRTKVVFVSRYSPHTGLVSFTEEYSGTIDYRQFTSTSQYPTMTLEDGPEPWFDQYWSAKQRERIKAITQKK